MQVILAHEWLPKKVPSKVPEAVFALEDLVKREFRNCFDGLKILEVGPVSTFHKYRDSGSKELSDAHIVPIRVLAERHPELACVGGE